MKIFTILHVCFLPFFSASLLAKPILPACSEPVDTLSLSENLKAEHIQPDSVSVKPSDIDLIITPDLCGLGFGEIDLIPDPATQCPCTYLWSTGATTEDITGLVGGQYNVTVTDVNGNWQVGIGFVNSLPPIVPNLTAVTTGNTLCNGTSNGAIDLTVSGVLIAYSVEWSNGAITQDLLAVSPGTYTVTVTVGTTCSSTASFTVDNLTNAPQIFYPGFGTDFCNSNTGHASVFPMGGIQPYTYEWTNGETTVLITDLAAGDYTITVTGADGCTVTYLSLIHI